MNQIESIPDTLLGNDHFQDDVSILIGENGSGKSTLLNKLSQQFLKKGKDVIALANSIHDKFENNNQNFRSLRGRTGRRQTRHTIKNALISAAEGDLQRLKNASQVLKYVGFDPFIGFRIDGLKKNFDLYLDDADLPDDTKEQLKFLLGKANQEFKNSSLNSEIYIYSDGDRFNHTSIIWLGIETFDFNELNRSVLVDLFKWEPLLKKLKIINRIEVFLRKDYEAISMLDASSGELVLITSLVYISTVITERTVILIDEPENSLHPKWQKEYVNTMLSIFYLYQPKIIIATHSPLIITGAEVYVRSPKIYKAENFSFVLQMKDPLNVEEILFRFFNVNTPQNRFLSERLVRYLNLLANNKISFESFKNEITKIESNSYDPKQINVLGSIIDIASQISLQ